MFKKMPNFEWREDHGYLAVEEFAGDVYDKAYFEKYEAYADTELGHSLTDARVQLVKQHLGEGSTVLDIGIGCGSFVQAALDADLRMSGFDVAELGIRWLQHRGLYSRPEWVHVNATFWDSFEHEADPWKYLAGIQGIAFMSIPLFRDEEHARNSKHFRPDEHYWYFTRHGLIRFMNEHGWDLIDENRMEEELGREDIGTFVWRKR